MIWIFWRFSRRGPSVPPSGRLTPPLRVLWQRLLLCRRIPLLLRSCTLLSPGGWLLPLSRILFSSNPLLHSSMSSSTVPATSVWDSQSFPSASFPCSRGLLDGNRGRRAASAFTASLSREQATLMRPSPSNGRSECRGRTRQRANGQLLSSFNDGVNFSENFPSGFLRKGKSATLTLWELDQPPKSIEVSWPSIRTHWNCQKIRPRWGGTFKRQFSENRRLSYPYKPVTGDLYSLFSDRKYRRKTTIFFL